MDERIMQHTANIVTTTKAYMLLFVLREEW